MQGIKTDSRRGFVPRSSGADPLSSFRKGTIDIDVRPFVLFVWDCFLFFSQKNKTGKGEKEKKNKTPRSFNWPNKRNNKVKIDKKQLYSAKSLRDRAASSRFRPKAEREREREMRWLLAESFWSTFERGRQRRLCFNRGHLLALPRTHQTREPCVVFSFLEEMPRPRPNSRPEFA
jgi:hypothetical protein